MKTSAEKSKEYIVDVYIFLVQYYTNIGSKYYHEDKTHLLLFSYKNIFFLFLTPSLSLLLYISETLELS